MLRLVVLCRFSGAVDSHTYIFRDRNSHHRSQEGIRHRLSLAARGYGFDSPATTWIRSYCWSLPRYDVCLPSQTDGVLAKFQVRGDGQWGMKEGCTMDVKDVIWILMKR